MLRRALPVVVAFAALNAQAQPASELAPESDAYPVVLTPTRLRQSLQDVPASVTVISSETLARYGVQNVVDALRLVPGMEITQPSGSDYRVNYHGTNLLTPRRMNVLIDGVSVYQPAFARVDWKNLPVVIEDIDRIEVTRGPNSAAYGPNSMMGIVNIITKHPDDVERGLIAAGLGSQGNLRLVGRTGLTFGRTSIRLTASREQDAGYDSNSRVGGDHDSTRTDRLNVRSHTKFGKSSSADLDIGYAGGVKQVPFADQYQTSYPDANVQDLLIGATVTTALSPNHQLRFQGTYWSNRVRQEWMTCPPTAAFLPELYSLWRANPSYALALLGGRTPSGGSAADGALAAAAAAAIAKLGTQAAQPTCAMANQNLEEQRVAFEVQDTYVVSDRLRAVGGAGFKHQKGNSATYLRGAATNSVWWMFANAEYKPRSWLSINAGGYVERDALSQRTTFSPRLAANVRISDTQALRAVWSTGTRTPDIQEQRANWSYSSEVGSSSPLGPGTVRFFQSAVSPGGLRSERIFSSELGYLLNVPKIGLLFDAKIFDDRLTSLISEKLQVNDFHPTNNGVVRLSGLELQGRMELSSSWSGFLNYSYLVNSGANNATEISQYSRHSGSVGVSHRLGEGWMLSAAYYGASGDGIGQSYFGRTDVTLVRTLKVDGKRLTAGLTIRRLDNVAQRYFRDFNSVAESRYDRPLQAFGYVQVSF